jgi:hypothetical protein
VLGERQALAAGTNLTADGTAFVAAAATPDGGLIVGGSTGLRDGNASLTGIGPDGNVEWTRQYRLGNASGIVDVAVGPDGDIYALQNERRGTAPDAGYGSFLVRVSGSGAVEWRQRVESSPSVGSSDVLAASGHGPALVVDSPGERSVTIRQYDRDGALQWNRSYGAEVRPTTLQSAGDGEGYLLVGTAEFDRPWLLGIGADGSERLNRTYEGIEMRRPVGMVPTDGGFVIAGTQAAHGPSAPAAAAVDEDGVVRWSRVYPTAADVGLRDVFASDDGIVLFGNGGFGGSDGPAGYLVGIGADGGQRYVERVGGFLPTEAAVEDGRAVAVGIDDFRDRNVTGYLRTTPLPDAPARAFTADAGTTSNVTHYRGQNLAVDAPPSAGGTVAVVQQPEDDADDGPRVVRRVSVGEDGRAVFESATLPIGEYYLRAGGDALVVENGTVTGTGPPGRAAFDLRRHDLGRVEVDRPFVDRAAGESGTSVSLRNRGRSEYVLLVSADRFRGGPVDSGTLRRLFADDPGFDGIDRSSDVPAARIHVDSESAARVATDGVESGLYRLTLRGADTGDGGAVAETRFVVGPERARPLSLSLSNASLSVPVGGTASTNVTVSGVTEGIGALSMSANRTGPPAVGLRTDLRIDAGSARGSARWTDREATASSRAVGGDTGNGTVTVGSLAVEAEQRTISPEAPSAATVTFGLDWVVDEDGVPYTLPGQRSVPVTVTDLENATGDDRTGGSASASGSVRSSGS